MDTHVHVRVLPAALLVVLAVLPAVADSRYDTALSAYRDGRYAEAIVALSGAELTAGEANLLGWAHLQAGNKDPSIDAFERSLELEPGLHDSHCGLGFTYLRSQAYEQAVESFEQALVGSPGAECVQGHATALAALGPDSAEQVEAYAVPPTEYVARGKYFWRRSGDDPFEILYVKGVNMSFARPGKYITEFPRETRAYLEWFRLIHEMNANVIRVYTILAPEFYHALREFNRGREAAERLLLIQGIWAELPAESRFRDAGYVGTVRQEAAALGRTPFR